MLRVNDDNNIVLEVVTRQIFRLDSTNSIKQYGEQYRTSEYFIK